MASAFDKVLPDSMCNSFSITAWNEMLEMLLWFKTEKNRTGGQLIRGFRNYDVADVHNASCADQPWLGVLGIDDVLYSPTDDEDGFQQSPVLDGITPVYPDHCGKWMVLRQPLEDDGCARKGAVVAGVVPVRVYVNSTSDKYCDVIDAETVGDETCYLGTGSSGATILWLDPTASAETIAWALVRLGGGGQGLTPLVLTSSLYACGSAGANILIEGSGAPCVCGPYAVGQPAIVKDTMGAVGASLLAWLDNNGVYVPATNTVWGVLIGNENGTPVYAAVTFGESTCTSDSDSPSSDSDSDSIDSDSDSVDSDSDSTDSDSDSDSGSSKDTAIVKASWSPSKYTALFVLEAPEVRFDDVMEVRMTGAKLTVPIDWKYLEVCAPKSIEVCGCVANYPVVVGATVSGKNVVLRSAPHKYKSLKVVIRLTGIRKGFLGVRFPDRTREEYEANERFIKRAAP